MYNLSLKKGYQKNQFSKQIFFRTKKRQRKFWKVCQRRGEGRSIRCWIGGREEKIVGLVEEKKRLLDWWKRIEDCWIGGREEKIGGFLEENWVEIATIPDKGRHPTSFPDWKVFISHFSDQHRWHHLLCPAVVYCCWEFEDKTREWRLSRRSKPCGFCIYLPKILNLFCLDKIDRDEQRW